MYPCNFGASKCCRSIIIYICIGYRHCGRLLRIMD
jgi:hypothetical protein